VQLPIARVVTAYRRDETQNTRSATEEKTEDTHQVKAWAA